MAWYWVLRRNHYQYHPKGIVLNAEKAAALVAAEGLDELKKAESLVYRLLSNCKGLGRKIQQKWNKLADLGAPIDNAAGSDLPNRRFVSPIRAEHYEHLNITIRRDRWILAILILGEGFLNYLTLLVVLPSNDLLLIIARAVIALIATIGTFKAFNWFLDAWDPTKDEESHWMMRVGSGALALAVLLVVGFVTTARARDFEGGEGGLGIVAIGFIGLSLVLPIIGGVIELHLARIRPLHSRMRKWRASLIDLRKFEGSALAELKQMEDALNAVETHILEQAKRWYAGVLDFRVRKDNRDENNKRAREDLTGTVAENIDVFTEACIKPFKVKLEAFEMSIAADKNEIQELVNRSIEVSKPLSAANRIEREPSPVGGDEREERAATAPSGKR